MVAGAARRQGPHRFRGECERARGLSPLTAVPMRPAPGEALAETRRERSNFSSPNTSLSMDTDMDLGCLPYINDAFRRDPYPGMLLITRGIAALPAADQAAILDRVRTFDAFTPENDPHGEHDFGAFEYNGQSIFWKITYYDAAMEYGSADPTDAAVTTLVLTIMLAEEY
jgi:hypothetical protein